ncbi:MAG: DUF3526 domain-containing protein [Bacteroidota bacterium]
MADLVREIRFCLNENVVRWTLLIAFVLSGLSLLNGMLAVEHQHSQLEVLKAETEADQAYVMPSQGDPGSAAYYIFHLTYDPPSEFTFVALGSRYELPWKHRIRMLALEGQIYENDPGNPELSYLGKLDFAYLISIVLPLLLIGLLFDLDARERRESRLELLYATSMSGERVLFYRACARALLLFVAVAVPFLIALLYANAPLGAGLSILVAVVLYMLFWLAVCRFVTSRKIASVSAAAILFGLWLLFTTLVPVLGKFSVERMVSVPDGGDILLTQRETVNDAWDLPPEATMDRFVAEHPEWEGRTAVGAEGFEWKWYYAFQQVGDQEASPLTKALYAGIEDRDRQMGLVALFSPPLLIERWLTHTAQTDVTQHLHYMDCVRNFHSSLRHFHYEMMFGDEVFSQEKMKQLPQFEACQ